MESCFLLCPLWKLRVFRFLLRDLEGSEGCHWQIGLYVRSWGNGEEMHGISRDLWDCKNLRNDASGQMVRGQIVWSRLWNTKRLTRRSSSFSVSVIIWSTVFLEILIQFSTYIIWYHMKYFSVQFVPYILLCKHTRTHTHASKPIHTCIITLTVTYLTSVQR